MSEHDSENLARLREEEQQAERERLINEELGGHADESPEAAAGPMSQTGEPLGQKGNDTSSMSLLNSDIDEVFKQRDEREPDPEIQQALQDLQDIPVREAIEEADS